VNDLAGGSKGLTTSTVRRQDYYYGNQHQVLAEYDGADDAQRYFVYGNFLLKIDEALLMHSNVDIGGNSTTGVMIARGRVPRVM